MKQKVKKLIERLFFINKNQKEELIAKLYGFSEEKLEKMYSAFSGLRRKEEAFFKDFFEKNPDLEEKAQTVVFTAEASAGHAETASGAIIKLGKFSKKAL